MSNQEPPSPILRRRDVIAWLPQMNREILESIAAVAEKEGKPITSQPVPGGRRFYLRDELKRRLGLA